MSQGTDQASKPAALDRAEQVTLKEHHAHAGCLKQLIQLCQCCSAPYRTWTWQLRLWRSWPRLGGVIRTSCSVSRTDLSRTSA